MTESHPAASTFVLRQATKWCSTTSSTSSRSNPQLKSHQPPKSKANGKYAQVSLYMYKNGCRRFFHHSPFFGELALEGGGRLKACHPAASRRRPPCRRRLSRTPVPAAGWTGYCPWSSGASTGAALRQASPDDGRKVVKEKFTRSHAPKLTCVIVF